MSDISTVMAGRAAAEARMREWCQITRPANPNDGVFNQATGETELPEAAVIYTGKCHVKATGGAVVRQPAGDSVFVQNVVIQVPVNSADARVGDHLTMLTASLDPSLAGTRYTVAGTPRQSDSTAFRLQVEEII